LKTLRGSEGVRGGAAHTHTQLIYLSLAALKFSTEIYIYIYIYTFKMQIIDTSVIDWVGWEERSRGGEVERWSGVGCRGSPSLISVAATASK